MIPEVESLIWQLLMSRCWVHGQVLGYSFKPQHAGVIEMYWGVGFRISVAKVQLLVLQFQLYDAGFSVFICETLLAVSQIVQ